MVQPVFLRHSSPVQYITVLYNFIQSYFYVIDRQTTFEVVNIVVQDYRKRRAPFTLYYTLNTLVSRLHVLIGVTYQGESTVFLYK